MQLLVDEVGKIYYSKLIVFKNKTKRTEKQSPLKKKGGRGSSHFEKLKGSLKKKFTQFLIKLSSSSSLFHNYIISIQWSFYFNLSTNSFDHHSLNAKIPFPLMAFNHQIHRFTSLTDNLWKFVLQLSSQCLVSRESLPSPFT